MRRESIGFGALQVYAAFLFFCLTAALPAESKDDSALMISEDCQ